MKKPDISVVLRLALGLVAFSVLSSCVRVNPPIDREVTLTPFQTITSMVTVTAQVVTETQTAIIGIPTATATEQKLLLESLKSGSYIVYSRVERVENGDAIYSMFIVSESGQGELKYVDGIGEGVLSPDYSTLAYQVSSNNGLTQNIYLLNLESAMSPPAKFVPDCFDPNWAPDGLQILMTCKRGDTSDIYLAQVSNNQEIPITDCIKEGVERKASAFACGHPALSPDGRWLASSRGEAKSGVSRSDVDGFYLTDMSCVPDTAACFEKTKGPFGEFEDYKWSPDSRSLAGIVYSRDIVIFDLATKQYRTLLKFDDPDWRSLAWSPNGSEIAYVQFDSAGNSDIYVTSISDQSSVKRVTNDGRFKLIMFWLKIP